MRHPKSRTLAAVIEEWSKPLTTTKADKAFFAWLSDYPHNSREAVYCWLWDNHAELTRLLTEWRPTWETIAVIMTEDGILGARGAPPTGNAVRRVWKRVCRDKEERDRRKGTRP
jgi:hypothetical protein